MMEPPYPDFIDHRDGNTLGQALRSLLGTAEENGEAAPQTPPAEVRIATAYFNPTGFAQVADHLLAVPAVRLLLGADLASTAQAERRRLDETPIAFERRRMRMGLESMADALRRERDRLPFNRPSGRALRKLISTLR